MIIGLLFTLSSAQFLLILMLGAAIAPDYSIHDDAISDLGVIPQTALLFNFSLFLFGLFLLIAAYLYHSIHNKLWITIMFISTAVGAIGVAFFPLNNPGIHAIFALIAFLFANLIPISFFKILPRPLNILSVATGILGLFFLFVHLLSDTNILSLYGFIGHGGSERMIVYPVIIWLVAFGGYILASSSAFVVNQSKP
jgi:hypothetical membrane protein